MRYLLALFLGALFGGMAGGAAGAGLALALEGGDLAQALEFGVVIVAAAAVTGAVIGLVAGLLIGILEVEEHAAAIASLGSGSLPFLFGIPVLADLSGSVDLRAGIAAWVLLVAWFAAVGFIAGSGFALVISGLASLARRHRPGRRRRQGCPHCQRRGRVGRWRSRRHARPPIDQTW